MVTVSFSIILLTMVDLDGVFFGSNEPIFFCALVLLSISIFKLMLVTRLTKTVEFRNKNESEKNVEFLKRMKKVKSPKKTS